MSRVLVIILTLLTFLLPVEARLASSRHVIFPDGRVEKFQFLPDRMDQALPPIGTPQWRFLKNRFATTSSHPLSSRQSLTCRLFRCDSIAIFMGEVIQRQLKQALLASGFTNRVKVRQYMYSRAEKEACLLSFRSEPYGCQINLFETDRKKLLIGKVITGVPQQGWIDGSWIAFGETLQCCPEVGTSFLEQVAPRFPTRLFRHPMIPEEVLNHFVKLNPLLKCLDDLSLMANELLVMTPENVVIFMINRDVAGIISAFGSLRTLATHFEVASK